MVQLTEWYRANSGGKGVGFFQVGGGIAGDFPICLCAAGTGKSSGGD